jgi:hypothetical protein
MINDYEFNAESRVKDLREGTGKLMGAVAAGVPIGSDSSASVNPAISSSVSDTSRAQTPKPDPLIVVQTTVPASSGTETIDRSSK